MYKRQDLDRLKNEQISLTEQIATLEAEKKKAKAEDQLSYTIEIETNKMNLKKNEYSQKSKQSEIDKLQSATRNTCLLYTSFIYRDTMCGTY